MTRTSLPLRPIRTDPAASASAKAESFAADAIRIRAGDAEAFERFFRATYAEIVRYLRAHVRDMAVAEELAQDVYLRIWRGRARLDPNRSLRAYLFRSAHNAAVNEGARMRVRAEHVPRPVRPIATDESVRYHELRDAVRAAIGDLPARTRQVFLLSREQGMTYAQIAAALQVSARTVENQMGRALRFLRDRLAAWR